MRTRVGPRRAHLMLAVPALAAAFGLAACSSPAGQPSGDPTPANDETSVSSPPEAAPAGRRDAPEPGTCWRVPPSNFLRDYWFDASPKVPCGRPHTSETVLVYDLERPTPSEALKMGSLCHTQARVYLRSERSTWVPW